MTINEAYDFLKEVLSEHLELKPTGIAFKACAVILHRDLHFTSQETANVLGRKDHTTILSHKKSHEYFYYRHPDYATIYDVLIKHLVERDHVRVGLEKSLILECHELIKRISE